MLFSSFNSYVIRNYCGNISLLPKQWKFIIWDARLLHERVPLFATVASSEGVLSLLDERETDDVRADFWNGFSLLQVL